MGILGTENLLDGGKMKERKQKGRGKATKILMNRALL